MCQLSIFLTGVLHMKSIFPEKMASLCLCLPANCFQACPDGALTAVARGRGLPTLSAPLASVISGHLAALEGLKKGARRVGRELAADGSPAPSNRPMLMTKESGGAGKLLLCLNEKDFFLEIANLQNCTW